MNSKRLAYLVSAILFMVPAISGLMIYLNQKNSVLIYYRARNTPQKISTRDDLNLGTITAVKGTHFKVKFPDGKEKEYVIIRLTGYRNGSREDLVPGRKVGVIGSDDEDGTYIAKIIQFHAGSPLDLIK